MNPRVYRILVVEDGLDTVRTTCALLRQMGHIVDYAINGYVALDLARRFKPDFVLLDIGLPGIGGLEVARQIKADPELMHVRIFVVTAQSREEYRQRATEAGCELFLVKPVSPGELSRLFGEPSTRAA